MPDASPWETQRLRQSSACKSNSRIKGLELLPLEERSGRCRVRHACESRRFGFGFFRFPIVNIPITQSPSPAARHTITAKFIVGPPSIAVRWPLCSNWLSHRGWGAGSMRHLLHCTQTNEEKAAMPVPMGLRDERRQASRAGSRFWTIEMLNSTASPL